MASFQSLFAPSSEIAEASSDALADGEGGEERAAKRLKGSYTVHVGPKVRF